VSNAFALEWLDNRLRVTIERTLTGILGYPVRVKFLVTQVLDPGAAGVTKLDLEPGQMAVKFYEFSPKGEGFLQTPKYDIWFWQPVVGCVPWATYQFLRCEEKLNRGWGDWFVVTVEELAATLGVSRQQITGVQRKGKKGKYWQAGALDRLEAAGIAKVERLGSGRNILYHVSCLHSLPLLTPQQVERLDPLLQEQHADFLRRARIEYEEWKQLELPTLVQP
jgi:hypothetical protein